MVGPGQWVYADVTVTFSAEVKFLGVWLDERLRPGVHVLKQLGKAEGQLALMRAAFRRSGGRNRRRHAVMAWVGYLRPTVEWSVAVWPKLPLYVWRLLEGLQRRAMAVCVGGEDADHVLAAFVRRVFGLMTMELRACGAAACMGYAQRVVDCQNPRWERISAHFAAVRDRQPAGRFARGSLTGRWEVAGRTLGLVLPAVRMVGPAEQRLATAAVQRECVRLQRQWAEEEWWGTAAYGGQVERSTMEFYRALQLTRAEEADYFAEWAEGRVRYRLGATPRHPRTRLELPRASADRRAERARLPLARLLQPRSGNCAASDRNTPHRPVPAGRQGGLAHRARKRAHNGH